MEWRLCQPLERQLLLGFRFGRVFFGQTLLGLPARDHEIVIVAVVSPRPGWHIAHFDKLPIG